jgi:hypothetical protein
MKIKSAKRTLSMSISSRIRYNVDLKIGCRVFVCGIHRRDVSRCCSLPSWTFLTRAKFAEAKLSGCARIPLWAAQHQEQRHSVPGRAVMDPCCRCAEFQGGLPSSASSDLELLLFLEVNQFSQSMPLEKNPTTRYKH